MINWENYEEYLMMQADGELNPAEEQELIAFMETHPQLKSELAAWGLTRLIPDEALEYPDKNALLKPALAARIITLPAWVKYSAAACIAGIVFSAAYKLGDGNSVTEITAYRHINQAARAETGAQAKSGPGTAMAAVIKTTAGDAMPARTKKNTVPKKPGVVKKQEAVQALVTTLQPSALPVAGVKAVACSNSSVALSAVEAPTIPAPVAEEEQRRSFWDWLPMEDDKKKRLQNIADAIAQTYDAGKTETNKKVNLKIENRKIKLIF